jgi:hypothetical protein
VPDKFPAGHILRKTAIPSVKDGKGFGHIQLPARTTAALPQCPAISGGLGLMDERTWMAEPQRRLMSSSVYETRRFHCASSETGPNECDDLRARFVDLTRDGLC